MIAKLKNIILIMLLVLLPCSVAYAATAADVFLPGVDRYGTSVKYTGSMSDGTSVKTAIDSKKLTWYNTKLGGKVERPIAKFTASWNGTTVTSDTPDNTLRVLVGSTVKFSDKSKAGSGNSIDFHDFQIHTSSGKNIEVTDEFLTSYTFDEVETYIVYLNIYDDLDSTYTRGWSNYGANGSHKSTSKFTSEGVYSHYYFAKLQIQVVEEMYYQGVVESHFEWTADGWETVKQDEHELEAGESITLNRITSYEDDEYLGYQVSENKKKYSDIDDLTKKDSVKVEVEEGVTKYVSFYYTYVSEGSGPPENNAGGDEIESDYDYGSGDDEGDITITVKHKGIPKGTTGAEKYLFDIPGVDDSTIVVHFKGPEAVVANKDWGILGYIFEYDAPDIDGFEFSEKYTKLSKTYGGCDVKSASGGHMVFSYTSADKTGGHSIVYAVYTQEYEETPPGPVEPEDGSGTTPDDPPWPEDPEIEEPDYTPPTVGIEVDIDTNGTVVNYKTLEGTLKGNASSEASIVKNDGRGRIDSHVLDLDIYNHDPDKVYDESKIKSSNTNTSDTNSTNLVIDVSMDDVGSLLIGTPGVSTSYDFHMTAVGTVELTDEIEDPISGENVPVSATAMAGGDDSITVYNEKPVVVFNDLVTKLDHYLLPDGTRVEVDPTRDIKGYFYDETPIKFDIDFNDYEDDMTYNIIMIGKGSTPGENPVYIATNGINPDTKEDVTQVQTGSYKGTLYDILYTNNDLKEFTAELTFHEPGEYWYKTYAIDAKSLLAVKKQSNIVTGTFTVKNEPAPPVADVTEPKFAYEEEKVEFVQNSTDPNGIDDILEYDWTFPDVVTPVYEASDPAGKDGGTITFPPGTAGNTYDITIDVTDATELTDQDTIKCKVIDQIPIARLEVIDNEDNEDRTQVKENRKITVSAANSLQPKAYPIIWNESVWTIEAIGDGAKDEYINWDTSNTNGNKQRVLQFDKPGKYRVTIDLVNQYSKDNPDSPDIEAAKAKIDITVYEDESPVIDVFVTSNKPNFTDNPVECVTVFNAEAESLDKDIIEIPNSYSWVIYEDINNDGRFTDDEVLPDTAYECDSTNKIISITTQFQTGSHNYIKAVAVGTEKFGQPYVEKLLPEDGSWKRTAEDFETYVINWVPDLELIPDQGPSDIPPTEFDPDPGTPYEEVDIDGDGITDGKFIRAYTDDIFSLKTKITDELPEIATMDWELEKKNHSGTYNKTDETGKPWIKSSKVTHTMGHDGGTMRIDSPGIYKLTGIVTDDCGETATAYVYVRVYTLPQAVLDTNPLYTQGGEWITKENIRFDLRSTPTIVDDEWGVAWHRMDWSKDNWDVIPKEGQDVAEIHFMNPEYTARYDDQITGDLMFSGRNSPIGFGFHTASTVEIIAMPGLFGMYDDPDNPKQLTSTMRDEFYEAADKLAKQVKEICPYFTVNMIKAPAYEDTYTRKVDVFGQFSGFLNQDDVDNKYAVKDGSGSEFANREAINGKSYVTGDLDAMIADNATGGWVDILEAYNANVPESENNIPYDDGDINVYMSLYTEQMPGSIEGITPNGTVEGYKITYSDIELERATADPSTGRLDAWYAGVKITAPEGYSPEAKYQYRSPRMNPDNPELDWDTQVAVKDFETSKDGSNYITLWAYFDATFVNNYVTAGKEIKYDARFDWDNDGIYEQTFEMIFDPTKITLTEGRNRVYPVNNGLIGDISAITENGLATGDKVAFGEITLDKATADPSTGRLDAWYAGVKVTAPEGYVSGAKFKYRNTRVDPDYVATAWESIEAKEFDTYKDGADYLTMWVYFDKTALNNYIAAGKNIVYDAMFDWDADGTYDQTFEVIFDPTKVTLTEGGVKVYPEGEVSVEETEPIIVEPIKTYKAEKVLVATGTCEADLEQVINYTRAADATGWKITTKNGQEYTDVNGKIRVDVEFSGQADDANLVMMARGWAGTIDDFWQTREIPLAEAYGKVETKPGAYKFILYANNNYGTQLYKGEIADNEDYANAVELLRAHEMYIANYGPPKADLVDENGAVVGEVNQELYFQDLATKLTYDGKNHSMYKIMAAGVGNTVTDYLIRDVFNWIKGSIPNSLNADYRSCSFTEPGKYDLKYWGTNYGGKVTVPVVYPITVIPDLPPNIHGEVLPKFYRDPEDGNRATSALLGPHNDRIYRQALTVESIDGDYIDFTKITVTYDANNNKLFTDATDTKWYMEERGTNYNGMDYTFERIDWGI